jgi:regulation of enolase protein 1 (concanavalin A-like superfamily)/fibronectin type 3 domain-containing protein
MPVSQRPGRARWAAPLVLFANLLAGWAAAASLPPGFSDATVARPDGNAWDDAVGVTSGPDGRLYVWERAGRVWVIDAVHPQRTPLVDLSAEVGAYGELGLTGFAVDPDGLHNGQIYLFYTVDPAHLATCDSPAAGPAVCHGRLRGGARAAFSATLSRITRYTLLRPAGSNDFRGATGVDLRSRRVLLGESAAGSAAATGCVVTATVHGAGALAFGTDGTLLASCGDGATDALEDTGHSAVTDAAGAVARGLMTPADDVGSFRAQRLDSLSGKVLRLDPATGDGLASNPFYAKTAPRSARSRVWALGLRDPQRFTVRPDSGLKDARSGQPGSLYIGDAGRFAWEALDVARGGRDNFGWPLFEGMDADSVSAFNSARVPNLSAPNPLYPRSCDRPYLEFRDLLKQEALGAVPFPNPCRPQVMLPASEELFLHTRPSIDWQHGRYARWSAFASDGSAIALPLGGRAGNGATVTGPLFGGAHSVGGIWYAGQDFPAAFSNVYLHADAAAGWIKAFRFDVNDNPQSVTDFIDGAGAVRALAAGRDEGLYFVTATPTGTSVHHVTYRAPAAAPAAAVAATGAATVATTSTISGATASAVTGAAPATLLRSAPLAAAAVASPLSAQDVGPVTTAGSYAYDGSTFTLSGAGADIYGSQDAFQFDYVPLAGDGSITALVKSLSPANVWSKAGVMIRETLGSTASNAAVVVTVANGVIMTNRAGTGATTTSVRGPASVTAPYWVRLTRNGSRFSGAVSADGLTWTPLAQATIGMAGTAYAGLAMTSHSTVAGTATYGSVSVVNAPSAPGGLTAVQQNGGAVLSWSASSPGTNGLTGYYVYRSDLTAPLATVTSGTTYTDMTVAANVSYSYYVVAFDRTAPTAFASAPSASVGFKLAGALLPPSAPLGLAAGVVTPTLVTLNWSASAAGANPLAGYNIYRTAGSTPITSVSGLTPIATTTGTSFSDATVSPGASYSYTVQAYDAATPTPLRSAPATAIVTATPTSVALSGTDIGAPGATGSYSLTGNVLTVNGAGADIYGSSDAFQFVSQPFVGDGTITARVIAVTATNAWTKAGVMIRESLAPGASHALMLMTPSSGANLQYRAGTGAQVANLAGPAVAAPYWVRLTRAGNTFTGYASSDGSNWTTVGSATVPMASAVYAGLAVTSHVAGTLATASFDSISFAGGGLVAPAAPTALAAGNLQPGSLTLSWAASTPGTNPIAGYYVYRGAATTPVSVTGTSFSDSGLTAGTTYAYAVAAYDNSLPTPLVSPRTFISVKTPNNATAPQAPATLTATAAGTGSVALAWSAAQPGSNGIGGYYVYRGGVRVAVLAGPATTYTDTGLAPTTSYSYTVAAYDQSTPTPLVSAPSTAATATTASPTAAPSVPSGLAVGLVTPTTVGLSWNPSIAGSNPIAGYAVYRTTGSAAIVSVAGLTQLAKVTGTSYTDLTATAGTAYSYTVVAYDSATAALSSAPATSVAALTPASQGLTGADIGTTGATGSFSIAGKVLTVNGAGADIWNSADGFQFVSQPFVGDGSITARVVSLVNTNEWAKAGVMLRESMAPGARHVFMALTPETGANLQYRMTANGISTNVPGPVVAAPYWVRLTRAGSVFTGSVSADGVNFKAVGQVTIPMAGGVYAGYAVTSHAAGTLTTASFDALAYSGGALVPPSAPPALGVSGVTASTVSLRWTAATAGTNPVAGYFVYRGTSTTPVAVSGTSFTDTGLGAATTYSYTVVAYDSLTPSPLVSAASAVQATTAGAGPVPPSAPSTVSATTQSSTSILVTWPAAAAGTNPIGGYYVFRNGIQVQKVAGSAPSNSFTDTGLTPSTTYSYAVAAYDNSTPTPLVSAASALAASATTAAGGGTIPPGQPGLPKVSATTLTSVTLSWTASAPGTSPVAGYFVYRGTATTPVAAVTTPSFTDVGLTSSTSYSYRVVAYDSATPTALLSPSSASMTASTTADVLTDVDVGVTGAGGNAVASAGNYSVAGSGADIWGTADAFNFAYESLTGDGTLTVYVASETNTDPWAKAGLMFRETLAPGSVHASMLLTPGNGGAFQYRPTTGAASISLHGNTVAAPYWVRVTRSGNVFSGYTSADGSTWNLVGSTTVNMAKTAYVGLAVTSHSAGTLSTAVFRSYAVTSPAASYPPLGISPRNTSILTSQTVQYSAALYGATTGTVVWSVDGVVGGSPASGTITTGGLYTAPATAGTHTIGATSTSFAGLSASGTVGVSDVSGVYTYHGDAARDGQYTHEYALSPQTVSQGTFGKLFSCAVDGEVYAQPLYVANLNIAGGVHNVVFVATMHDTVYAFDADSPTCVQYWKTAYVTGDGTVTSVPNTDIVSGTVVCADINTEYGITGTPVIDPATKTLYFVTKTKEAGSAVQRLHALDLTSGTERVAPVVIAATYNGVPFNPLWENQRAGLALSNGQVYVAWASHCDYNTWYGWVMAYDAQALTQTAVFNDSPTSASGGIWMSGGAPAIDGSGNLYVTTGNGPFTYSTAVVPPLAPTADYGESYLKLTLTKSGTKGTISVSDFYTPSQNAAWTAADLDISASGVVVLPDGAGPAGHPNVVFGSDKSSHLWILDRAPPTGGKATSMGGFNPNGENVVQYASVPTYTNACSSQEIFGTPAFWNGTAYLGTGGGPVLAVPLVNGLFAATAGVITPAQASSESYGFPSPTPVVSATGAATNGIVWALDNAAYGGGVRCANTLGPAVLRAYDATTMATLYSSALSSGDAAGGAIKFQVPVVANGRVYVAGSRVLTVYGLLP